MLEMFDTAGTWLALIISVISSGWLAWTRYKDETEEQMNSLRGEIAGLRSFHDRLTGATIVQRVAELESRQRDTETAMARVEQRLASIDSLLEQIHASIQQLASKTNV